MNSIERVPAQADDVRFVTLTGKERSSASKDGHVTFRNIECPFCGAYRCTVHFGLDGNGRFACRPCSSMGSADHGEYAGKRYFMLTLEGMMEDEGWKH